MKFQPVQPAQISPYDYMGKSVFTPARRDRFPPGISLQKPIGSHWFKNIHKMMEFYEDICLLFLTDRRHMRHKNTIEITMIC